MSLLQTTVREAWLWLGASVLVALLWTNLTWLFSPWVDLDRCSDRSASLAEKIVFRIAHWRFSPSLYQGLRLLYYAGLPFVALFWGRDAVVSRLLGLQPLALPSAGESNVSSSLSANWTDWMHDLGWTTILGVGTMAVLILARLAYRRALSSTDSRGREGKMGGWRAARDAAYHEIHWAFYRNAPIMAFGLYWGTWTALILVALEAVLNPTWRRDLREPGRVWSRLVQAAIAPISSLLYLRTQNLWLAVLLHWGIVWTATLSSDETSSGE